MSDLVFDIGMHKGDDSFYYLARGYRVVAVEANPIMCAMARERFAREISAGQLSVWNIGIAETRGEMDFWVSNRTEWSSFHVESATKNGARATSVRVETMPFRQLIEEEGTPFFVKIDIEGNDNLCLKDLAATASRPAYLSFEGDLGDIPFEGNPNTDVDTNIKLLESLGYRSFKCVRQNDLREITPQDVVSKAELRRTLKGLEGLPRPVGLVCHVLKGRLHLRKPITINGWQFNFGSSGPLGVELPGRWLTSDEVLSVWHQLIAYDANGLAQWFDIHAAHDSAGR